MPWDFSEELAKYGPAARSAPATPAGARAYCRYVTRTHYENFSVASLFLPRRLLRHFHAVYAYCRWSDDLADETGGGTPTRELLDWWRGELMTCFGGVPRHPVLLALRETIQRFRIPPQPFLDLLTAFVRDQHVKRYGTFEELLGYCRYSANPVGHLVLYLLESFDPVRARLSDEVCTGLQLANFWQDVRRDFLIGRVYLPEEDRERYGVPDADIASGHCSPAFRELLRFQVERTHGFFDRGEALVPLMPREVRVDVALFIRGGRAILQAIERAGYDVLSRRPVVTRFQKARLLTAAVTGQVLGVRW